MVAKEYGISDVGLAMMCRRLEVPIPGLGYWAKKQHGKPVEQIPLPPPPADTKLEVTINTYRKVAPDPEQLEKATGIIDAEELEANEVKVELNPEPEDADGEGWESVLSECTELAAEGSLREHVRALADTLREGNEQQTAPADMSWLRRLAQYGRFSAEDEALLVDLSVVAGAAEAADSTWVLLLPNNDWKDLLSDERRWMAANAVNPPRSPVRPRPAVVQESQLAVQ